MTGLHRASRFVAIAIAVAGLLLGSGGVRSASAAETTPDSSDVVLGLDFSASILNDARNRARFAGALERMADRVDALSADLVTGDTTVSLVQFASKARDVEGCTDLHLLNDPEAVATFADCLRTVGAAYRRGLSPNLEDAIGIDTNYVEAMEKGASHLPDDSERPTMILFTDGRHDVAGVPRSEVPKAFDRLFGDRSPVALLPVGMGLAAGDREELTAGLEDLRVVRDMPPCVSGTTFEWPNVVFNSPDAAGNAVAAALQAATCTFTVAPTEPPTTPAPPAAPGAPRDIRLTPGDGFIDMAWSPPAEGADAVTDYRARCISDDGTIESAEGVSAQPGARVEGLEQGREYRCEVATVTAAGDGDWVPAGTASPLGIPPPPAIAERRRVQRRDRDRRRARDRRRGVSLRMLRGRGRHVGGVDRRHVGEHDRPDPRPGKRNRVRLQGVRRERDRPQRRLRTVELSSGPAAACSTATRSPCRSWSAP